MKSNLKLELQRHLAENNLLAQREYDTALKHLQKERVQNMEKEIRKLFGNQQILTVRDKEKRDLYTSVMQFVKTETWPCTLKLNYYEMSEIEIAEKIFEKTTRCNEHPLSQWLLLVHTNIKREVDALLKKYSSYQALLPGSSMVENWEHNHFKELPSELVITSPSSEGRQIPTSVLASVGRSLEPIASEINACIGNTMEIFYLVYKSLLAEGSEDACHKLIESYFLSPVWSNLFTVYRISNMAAEYKLLSAVKLYKDCPPSRFGFPEDLYDADLCAECLKMLCEITESTTLCDKLKMMVTISQKICGSRPTLKTQGRRLGADELIPLLCYLIVKSRQPQLVSECLAIEQLSDMKYVFGEEGYAISSFITALKYLEMKELIDEGITSTEASNQ